MKRKNYMKVPTLTVAVCAYNESVNISYFLDSVFKQKEEGYSLKKIVIISDGSTDDTVAKVNRYRSQKISLIAHKDRRGKSTRLNEIYQNLTTDIIFQSDADVVLAGSLVLTRMVRAFLDPKVTMASGNAVPYKPKTLMEKAVHVSRSAYHPLKTKFKGGNNKFSVNGRILAYRASFIKRIRIPEATIGNDVFTYFACLQKNFSYRYVQDAIVRYRSPMTLSDHIKQNTRFVAVPDAMGKYFPKELVAREYALPTSLKVFLLAKQFIKHPILSMYIFTINKYCQLIAILQREQMHGPWKIAESTKKIK